jgi:hypothetical protein
MYTLYMGITITYSGTLRKRGFHWFKRWVDRKILLAGRNLFYYKIGDSGNSWMMGSRSRSLSNSDTNFDSFMKAKGYLELSEFSSVHLDTNSSLDGYKNVLVIKPDARKKNGGGNIWYLTSNSIDELREFEEAIAASIKLVGRCNSAPTLRGMGLVSDHFTFGKKLGEGKFGVVKEGQYSCGVKSI